VNAHRPLLAFQFGSMRIAGRAASVDGFAVGLGATVGVVASQAASTMTQTRTVPRATGRIAFITGYYSEPGATVQAPPERALMVAAAPAARRRE
jgi:hypothetical protein